jgi:hypothetical protein
MNSKKFLGIEILFHRSKMSRNFPPLEVSAEFKSLCVGIPAFVGYFQCQMQIGVGGVLSISRATIY